MTRDVWACQKIVSGVRGQGTAPGRARFSFRWDTISVEVPRYSGVPYSFLFTDFWLPNWFSKTTGLKITTSQHNVSIKSHIA